MSHPLKVSLLGPLAMWREPLTPEFVRLGYAPSTIARQIRSIAPVFLDVPAWGGH